MNRSTCPVVVTQDSLLDAIFVRARLSSSLLFYRHNAVTIISIKYLLAEGAYHVMKMTDPTKSKKLALRVCLCLPYRDMPAVGLEKSDHPDVQGRLGCTTLVMAPHLRGNFGGSLVHSMFVMYSSVGTDVYGSTGGTFERMGPIGAMLCRPLGLLHQRI